MLSQAEKQAIADALREKIAQLSISNNEASKRIGVSAATISNMLNGKWESITDAWLKVLSFVESRVSGWQVAETANFLMIQDICKDAQRMAQSRAISFKPGSGKTFSSKYFAENNPNVFYVASVGDMSKRQLLQALCTAMGIGSAYRLADMLEDVIAKLSTTTNPLIIIDEFDEVDNKAMRIFKDLYNRCNVGIVLVGGRHLQERIMRGVRNCKQSYHEIYSRIGGEFISLKEVTKGVVEKICRANGVMDVEHIKDIYAQANGDLRRVKAMVEAILITSKN